MKESKNKIYKKIVEEIVEDLNERNSLRQTWEMIDEVTQQGIKDAWEYIIDSNLGDL